MAPALVERSVCEERERERERERRESVNDELTPPCHAISRERLTLAAHGTGLLVGSSLPT
jgi:hypothetical protein